MSNIFSMNDDPNGLDMEYFQQLIESKLDSGQKSYLEQLAMRQIGSDVDPEEELQNALDEIKKHEKDISMIAMVAQTLFEKQSEMQQKLYEQENDILNNDTKTAQMMAQIADLEYNYDQKQKSFEKIELEKRDLDKDLANIGQRYKRIEQKLIQVEKKYATFYDESCQKELKYQQNQFQINEQKKDLTSQIENLQYNIKNIEKQLQKTTNQADSKEQEIKRMIKQDKDKSVCLAKLEQDLKILQKKYDKSKKYSRELEDKLIKKEAKIKEYKLQKKNDDLCSQIESVVDVNIVNDLQEIDQFQSPQLSSTKNLLNDPSDEIQPIVEQFQLDDDYDNFNKQSRKNSLLEMEENFISQNDFQYDAIESNLIFQEKNDLDDLNNEMINVDQVTDQPLNSQQFDREHYGRIQQFHNYNQLIDQDTQTNHSFFQIETQTQTEIRSQQVGFTQTINIDKCDEDCQTEQQKFMMSKEIQTQYQIELKDKGTNPDQDIFDPMFIDIQQKIKMGQTNIQIRKSKLSLEIPQDISEAQNEDKRIPKPLQTTKEKQILTFDNDFIKSATKSPENTCVNSKSGFSFKDQVNYDYMMKRDPMEEFFTLTCQSIKLNSPHMQTICTIDSIMLYKKAVKLNIPFFKWSSWIEDFLNKEFMRAVLKKGRISKQRQQMGETFIQIENKTKQQILDQAQKYQKELENHQLQKANAVPQNVSKKKSHGRQFSMQIDSFNPLKKQQSTTFIEQNSSNIKEQNHETQDKPKSKIKKMKLGMF